MGCQHSWNVKILLWCLSLKKKKIDQENEVNILAFFNNNAANPNDAKQLLGNLRISNFFVWKSYGKSYEGYLYHSNTLKVLGRCLGPLEKRPFLIISVLRFFILLKASPSHSTSLSLNKGKFINMISIRLVPF